MLHSNIAESGMRVLGEPSLAWRARHKSTLHKIHSSQYCGAKHIQCKSVFSTEKHQSLSRLSNQKDYEDWTYRQRAHSASHGYDKVLKEEDPAVAGRKSFTKPVYQTVAVTSEAGQPYVDQDGKPITRQEQLTTIEVEESIEAFETRCANWKQLNLKLWSVLIACCYDEAAVVMRKVPEHDGKAGIAALKERFEGKHVSTIIALLRDMMQLKQGNTATAEHVTAWQELIRRITEQGTPIASELEAALFLQTLAPAFQPFIAYQTMQSKVEITKLYADVKEYGKNNLKDSDEASAKGIAFWTTDANRG